MRYKLTYPQIAKLNPFQQLSMLRLNTGENLFFETEEDYLRWRAKHE